MQKVVETTRNGKRRELYDAEDQIEGQKDRIIETVAARLRQTTTSTQILLVRWLVA